MKRFGVRFALGAGAIVLVGALAIPTALGQGAQPRRGGVFDSFFGPFSGPRFGAPQEPRADYSRAPPPRRTEAQAPTTVLVLGDSMADWLAHGLEDALADAPEFGVVRRHRTTAGLIRYDARNENQDWAQAAREAITATKPKFIIMMVGLHDRQSIRMRPASPAAPSATAAPQTAPASPTASPSTPPPASGAQEAEVERPADQPSIITPEAPRPGFVTYEFRSEPWAEQYAKRIDATIAALKTGGVPVFWVGLPAIRGPRSTSDMQYLDELYRTRSEKGGITYIDVWDGFVDDGGRFVQQGPDFEGQIRRLRVADGVHFTKAGARKLAHYVERELRRAMTRGVMPVALPMSEPSQQAAPAPRPGQPTARPLTGPVLPLTAAAGGQQDLAGGTTGGPAIQPIASRVLQKGEAVPAPAGRSDDFAWPRRSVAPFGTDPVVATTTDPIPVMLAAPAATTVPVPNEEVRPVAAAAPRRAAPRPLTPQQQAQQQWQQQQQRRANNVFSFPFFR